MFTAKIKNAICLVMFLLVAQPQILQGIEDSQKNQDQAEIKTESSDAQVTRNSIIALLVGTMCVAAGIAIRNHQELSAHKDFCRVIKNVCTLDPYNGTSQNYTVNYNFNGQNLCSCERDVRATTPREEWFASFTCYNKICKALGVGQ